MRLYFVGFQCEKEIRNMLYDQEVLFLRDSYQLDNTILKKFSGGIVFLNLTESCTIRKSEIENLIEKSKTCVGFHSVVITDKKHYYYSVPNIRVQYVSRESAETIVLRFIREIKGMLESFVGKTTVIKRLKCNTLHYAFQDGNVLILGETGTGKTLLAEIIHRISQRKKQKLVKLNCATIPESLIESELFGHAKGSFTGADSKKEGLIKQANGGHMFLDEIAELSPDIQAKLLYIVDQGTYYAIGDPTPKKADVKFISATNKEPKMIRADLFFRLAENVLRIPPLRQRKADIPLIVDHYFESNRLKIRFDDLKESEKIELFDYDYPGNVRELENILKEYMRSGELGFLSRRKKYFSFYESDGDFNERLENSIFDHASSLVELAIQNDKLPKLSDFKKRITEEVEKQYVKKVLEIYKWNKKQVSKEFGISSRYLNKLILKYSLDKRTKTSSQLLKKEEKTEQEKQVHSFLKN